MPAPEEEVHVWDKWGKELEIKDVGCMPDWEDCRKEKRFPNGLIEFLSSDKGCAYAYPTPVQSYAWPALLAGSDLIGIAKTGSGKTLAFLLPAFMWLKKNKKTSNPVDCNVGPAVLCLTPTRELCHQIFTDCEKFGEPVQITAACAFGGANRRDQEWKIKQGPHCLIATPGRLNDFANTHVVDFSMCRFCILDEADRMLDMGFEPQIKEILNRVPEGRQTSMFTATWSKEVRSIADTYISNPVVVQIGAEGVTGNRNITQHVMVCASKEEKKAELDKILDELVGDGVCLVFCNTKRQCHDLCWEVSENCKFPAVELHGDLAQHQRDESLRKFKAGEAKVMCATDLAARGLDIRTISHVVNWDVPNSGEDYVHRIGRTGRASDKGNAYTFFNSWGDDKKAATIKGCFEAAGQVPPQALDDLANGRTPGESGEGSSWDKKDDSWEEKHDSNDSKDGEGEKRIHSADKANSYTWEGFVEFSAGDMEKAKRLWGEATPVPGTEKKDDSDSKSEKKEDKWWEKKEEEKKEEEPWPKEEDDGAAQEAPEAEDAYDHNENEGEKRPLKEDEEEGPPSKRAKADEGDEVAQALIDYRGSELTLKQLKDWLTKQGLASNGLKAALIERAEEAAREMFENGG